MSTEHRRQTTDTPTATKQSTHKITAAYAGSTREKSSSGKTTITATVG